MNRGCSSRIIGGDSRDLQSVDFFRWAERHENTRSNKVEDEQ
jgi:hypothetical protein